MKYMDEVDIELVNQELNFNTNDNSLVIKGGCDLFTTKPIGSDRKLYKTIDKHFTQMIRDNEMSRTIEKERKNSINSLFSSSPIMSPENNFLSRSRHNSFATERRVSTSGRSSVNDRKLSVDERKGSVDDRKESIDDRRDSTTDTSLDADCVDESPFGSLKISTTKWTFAYLIAILNTTFPDHDFSNLQPTTDNFHKLNNSDDLISRFNNIMMTLGKTEETTNWIWDRIDSYMELLPKGSPTTSPNVSNLTGSYSKPLQEGMDRTSYGEDNSNWTNHRKYSQNGYDSPTLNTNHCQIFEFRPSDQSILEDLNYPYQTMWSYYWFIYNKKKKRVAFIYLTALNKIHYTMVNSNRKSSFRSSRRNIINKSDIIHNDYDDDEVDEDDNNEDVFMNDYMDEEVFVDDDSDESIDDIQI